MDAIIATLITVSGDIPATIEFYRNYFILKGWNLALQGKDC